MSDTTKVYFKNPKTGKVTENTVGNVDLAYWKSQGWTTSSPAQSSPQQTPASKPPSSTPTSTAPPVTTPTPKPASPPPSTPTSSNKSFQELLAEAGIPNKLFEAEQLVNKGLSREQAIAQLAPAKPPAQTQAQTGSIPFRPGLSSSQQASIQNLVTNKSVDQWSATDRANWNYATNGAPLPGGGGGQSSSTGLAPAQGQPSLIDRVEATNGSLSANKEFINGAYQAYKGRDATATELSQLTGMRVDEVRRIAQSGAGTGEQTGSQATSTNGVSESTSQNNQAEIDAFDELYNGIQEREASTIESETSIVDLSKSTELLERLFDVLDNPQPEAPNLQQTFAEQRQALGVGELEDALAAVDADIEKLDADFSSLLPEEENRRVSVRQIRRRQSESETQYRRQRRDLEVERNAIANQLNNKYQIVNSMMQFSQQDFQNAQAQYTAEFSKAITVANLIRGIEQDAKTDQERNEDGARANLQVMYNAIVEGNIDVEDLSPTQELALTKLELEAGLPVGLFKTLSKEDPGAKIITHGKSTDESGNEFVWVMSQKDGGPPEISYVGDTGGKNKTTNSRSTNNSPSLIKLTNDEKNTIKALGLDNTSVDFQNVVINALTPSERTEYAREWQAAQQSGQQSIDPELYFNQWVTNKIQEEENEESGIQIVNPFE